MQVLLDTHTLIWALEDNPKLNDKAKEIILNLNNQIFVSAASIWEIAIKKSIKEDFPYNAKDLISYSAKAGFRFLGIGLDEIVGLNTLKVKEGSFVNNDPFDKILVSQAKVNKMLFLTHDHVIKQYDEPCVFVF